MPARCGWRWSCLSAPQDAGDDAGAAEASSPRTRESAARPGRCAHHALKPLRTTPGRSRSLRRSSGDVWCVGPTSRTIHLIVDNYSTHKHRHVKSWFERHARFHAHFIPTSSSWLNLVERFFREITDRRIRRGIFRSVQELTQAIYDFLKYHNENPRPFVWTKTADQILNKLAPLYLIHPLILLSNDTKDSLEYPLLHKHLQKPLHQWTDSLIRPVGNMVIQHQPLTKQRVRTIFHRVRL